MSFARAVPIALLLALAAPAAANADATVSVTGRTLTFEVNDSLGHGPVVSVQGGEVVVSDNLALSVGAGCTLVGDAAHCGALGDLDEAVFTLGDGNDVLDLRDFPIPVTADGGGGGDVLYGGLGDDALSGGPGGDSVDGTAGDDGVFGDGGNDAVVGGDGFDLIDGGDGDDRAWANEEPARADFEISCGAGQDVVIDYDVGDPVSDDCETTDSPYLDGELRITGDAREGSQLQLSLPPNIGGDGTTTLQWERCYETVAQCVPVGDPNATTYTPTSGDVGSRVRAWYRVENALGNDFVMSDLTQEVAAPLRPQRPPRPPRPTRPPPTPHVDPYKLTIAPFAIVRKPSFAIRNGRSIVDTGRTMACPGVAGGLPCHLHLSARPAGASAHWRGRPAVAGELGVDVAAGAGGRVRFELGNRAYRLLRAHRKLTLTITATITRSHSAPVKTTFVITIKAPPTKRH